MIDWRRICCAVDFADPSRVAMAAAADIAKRFEAELTLVHVVAPPPSGASDVLVSSRELARMQADEDGETLARWRADAEVRAGRPVRSRVLSGAPAEQIVEYAREQRHDLIVVGTHGRTGIPHLVLGSVAERVVRQSPCPVLVVHDHGALEKEQVAEEIAQYR